METKRGESGPPGITGAILAFVSLAALVAACSESPCREIEGKVKRVPGQTTCRMTGLVRTEVTGAETISDRGKRALVVFEFYKGKLPKATWFGSVKHERLIDFAPKQKFGVGFDIAPGTYRGQGRYKLSAERPTVEGLSSPVEAGAVLNVSSLRPEHPGFFIYNRFVEPCSLQVRDKMTRGKLVCPKLADENGSEVSVTMTWEPA